MPTSNMKVKSGTQYAVRYRVVGSMNDLSTDQLKMFAERYLRTAARSAVLGKLNEIEPAIAGHKEMYDSMKQAGFDPAMVEAFFKAKNLNLEVPTTFEIPIVDLLPDEDSTRGKKAADVFTFESTDEVEDSTEEVVG